MTLLKNISLKPYNTFGIDVNAKQFIEIDSEQALKEALIQNPNSFILGGGSNMLLTKDIAIPVIKIGLKGISQTAYTAEPNCVLVSAMAGENWHDFVMWCIKKNYGGLENLALIPGTVGACPIQNIGAYGVEVKDTIYQVEALDLKSKEKVYFSNADCQFGYRDSIFKSEAKNKYVILKVTFKLTTSQHQINSDYGALKTELQGIIKPNLSQIGQAIIKIRRSKLPDPKEIGNSGSFFKNPIIDFNQFKAMQKANQNCPFYRISENQFKIPAGWLIEQCGFKGKRIGDAGVHQQQALVLVNYGNASGTAILFLAKTIQKTVMETFKIDLEIEVNVFS